MPRPSAAGFLMLTVAAAMLGGGCASSVDTERAAEDVDGELGQTSSAWTSDPDIGPFCNSGAQGMALVPRWSSTLTGNYRSTTALNARVDNRLSVAATISVDLRASGLGGLVATRRIYDGTVRAGLGRTLTAAVGDIPLQSPDEVVQAELVVTILAPAQYAGVVISSRPLYSRPTDSTFSSFAIHGETRPTSRVLFSPTTFEEAVAQVHAAVEAVRPAASGRFWNAAAIRWQDLVDLPQPGDEFHFQNRGIKLTADDSLALGAMFGPGTGPVDNGYAPVRVCAQWPAHFVDENRGESFGSPYAAAYAEFVLAEGTSVVPWSGTLDSAGCTPPMTLQNYTGYTLVIRTKLHREVFGSGTSIDILDKNGQPETAAVGFSTLDVLRPQPANPININVKTFSDEENETRVAAVVSAALRAQGPRIPAGDYTLRANQGCDPKVTACFRPESLAHPERGTAYIGPNPDTTHNSQFKFVVAHEFGHAVQAMGTVGLMRADYDNSPSRTNSGACGCGFVDDAANDGSHCLQSKNKYGIATNEGFAHYFASTVWNSDDPASCTFVYYKNFKEGNVVLRPPVVRSCAARVKWMQNNCAEALRGVEWDWMNFQRAVQVSTSPTPLDELLDIYTRSCGGTSCFGVERGFPQLAVAADQKYGFLDPRALEFRSQGSNYGVDY